MLLLHYAAVGDLTELTRADWWRIKMRQERREEAKDAVTVCRLLTDFSSCWAVLKPAVSQILSETHSATPRHSAWTRRTSSFEFMLTFANYTNSCVCRRFHLGSHSSSWILLNIYYKFQVLHLYPFWEEFLNMQSSPEHNHSNTFLPLNSHQQQREIISQSDVAQFKILNTCLFLSLELNH